MNKEVLIISKVFLLLGLSFICLSAIFFVIGKAKNFSFKILPGDIFISRGNFTFYFPITTGIVLSLVLSVLFFLFFRN